MWDNIANAASSNGGNNFLTGGVVLLVISTVSRWLESAFGLLFQYVWRSVFISVVMVHCVLQCWVANADSDCLAQDLDNSQGA